MGKFRQYTSAVTPSSSAGYEPGGNWLACAICGFRVRAYEAKYDEDVGWVCPEDFDDYNPQEDGVPGVEERIAARRIQPEPIYVPVYQTINTFPFTLPVTLTESTIQVKITPEDL